MCIIGNTILLFPILGLELFNTFIHDLKENKKLLLIILFSSKLIFNSQIFPSYFSEKMLASNEEDTQLRHKSKFCLWR